MRTLVVPTDGPCVVRDLDGYEAWQAVLAGGYLTPFPLRGGALALLDEAGIPKRLPANPLASAILHRYGSLPWDDVAVGVMLVVGLAERDGEVVEVDLPEDLEQRYVAVATEVTYLPTLSS